MNRREFLKRMGLAGLVLATPKLIFDLGANKNQYAGFIERKFIEDMYPRRFILDSGGGTVEVFPHVVKNGNGYVALNPEYDEAPLEEVIFYGKDPYTIVSEAEIQASVW